MAQDSGMNKLFYGDNLQVLREHIADESVDLIYLDPPFNSKRDYNLLFKSPKRTAKGAKKPASGDDPPKDDSVYSDAQITAFEDTWHWNLAAEQTYSELINEPDQVGRMIESFRGFIGTNQMMAYLVMMAARFRTRALAYFRSLPRPCCVPQEIGRAHV